MMKSYEMVEIFALIFWSFQLAPQAVENWKRQSTIGLSPYMMLLWSLGSLCTGIYCVGGQFGVLFILQPNLFLVFSIICYTQCFYYDVNKSIGILYGSLLTLFTAIVEVLGGYFLSLNMSSLSTNNNDDDSSNTNYWAFTLVGASSTAFFAIGFVPQFSMIYHVGYVEGVSLLFLSIDITGALLSILSLLLQGNNFQPISITCYIVVVICDLAIVILSFLLPIPSKNPIDNEAEVAMNTFEVQLDTLDKTETQK